MRTIVDIPQRNIQALAICSRENISRAEAMRRAVSDYLARHQDNGDTVFGLWRERSRDSLDDQHALREEWSARSTSR